MKQRLARTLATWFGLGTLPLAPGTWGALGAIPFHLACAVFTPAIELLVLLALLGLGLWSAETVARESQEEDPQIVVIDEVVGVWIAFYVAGTRLWPMVAAFVLFRVFDIWKPWPIRRLEHWRPVSLGIMADDVAAGLLAAGLTALVVHWGF